MTEKELKIKVLSGTKTDWYFDLTTTADAKLPFQNIGAKQLDCKFENLNYSLKAKKGTFSKPESAVLRLSPKGNSIVLNMAEIN